jgi:hypothetical protein
MEDPRQDTALHRFQNVYNRLRSRGSLPDFLYHYTDAGGIDGILNSKTIWFSNFEFLNDSQEFIYARDFMMERLRYIERTSIDERERSLAGHLHALNHGRARVFFVFSLCLEGNQLSQWRAYTPRTGGYAIGFRGEWLNTLAMECGATLVPVRYGNEVLMELFEVLFAACLESWDDSAEGNNLTAIDGMFLTAMSEVAVFCKHEVFREEAEWRMIVPGKALGTQVVATRPRGPYMLPYVSVSFAGLIDKERTIVPPRDLFSIKIGPGMDQSRAQRGLFYMLRNCGVTASFGPNNIPYRPD